MVRQAHHDIKLTMIFLDKFIYSKSNFYAKNHCHNFQKRTQRHDQRSADFNGDGGDADAFDARDDDWDV